MLLYTCYNKNNYSTLVASKRNQMIDIWQIPTHWFYIDWVRLHSFLVNRIDIRHIWEYWTYKTHFFQSIPQQSIKTVEKELSLHGNQVRWYNYPYFTFCRRSGCYSPKSGGPGLYGKKTCLTLWKMEIVIKSK